jgi:hypothetical protein
MMGRFGDWPNRGVGASSRFVEKCFETPPAKNYGANSNFNLKFSLSFNFGVEVQTKLKL